ncbi:MAG: trimethylamine methyltransferase family protein [Candidatus Coatesbacteria bacterium]
MKRIRYELAGGPDARDLEAVRGQVLEVLEKVGVDCPHERTLNRLAGDTGIRVDGSRVYFAPSLVDATIEAFRRAGPQRAVPDEVTIGGPWNCFNIEDMETGRVRASTSRDVREMFKLLYAAGGGPVMLGAVRGGPVSPVFPADIPGPLQVLYVEKAGIELTRTTGSLLEFGDERMEEIAIEMHKAAGRRYRMMVEFPISPLRFNPRGLDKIWTYRDRTDIDLYAAAAPIPQAGATAPRVLPGGIVQSVAETYAGAITVDRITEGRIPVRPEFRLEISDLRTMTTAFGGAPEYLVTQMAMRDVYRYFTGNPRIECCFQTNAKRCDLQAMMEKTSWVVVHALGGFRDFWFGAGQLSMDEVFSPAQFVIDLELGRYAARLVRGVAWDDEPGAAFRVIAEAAPGGDYLTHDSTMGALGDLHESDLFPRTSVAQWREAGEPDLRDRAIAKAKALIAGHDHRLDERVQRELDRLWAKAQALAGG